MIAVVDRADNERLVRIALQEHHDHFLVDARDEDSTPPLA